MFSPRTPEATQEHVPASREELAKHFQELPEPEQVKLATDYLEAQTTPVIEATRSKLKELAII